MRIPKVKDYKHLEDVVNKTLNLIITKGSGCVHGDGDGKGREIGIESYSQLIAECKHTEKSKKSISVTKNDFNKTSKAALRLGRIAAMFNADADGDIYTIIKLSDFADIYRNHIEFLKNNGDTNEY